MNWEKEGGVWRETKSPWPASNQGCYGYILRLLFFILYLIILCKSLSPASLSTVDVLFWSETRIHVYCKWHTKMRSCFFQWESTGTGIIILARVWSVSSFQESLRLTMTQIRSFWKFWAGLSAQRTQTVSFSLRFSIPSFLSLDRIAGRQCTQCFPLNKPRVTTEDPVCDQWKEARGTGKTWKG